MNNFNITLQLMIQNTMRPSRSLRTNTCPAIDNPERCPNQSEALLKLLPPSLLLLLYKCPSQLTCSDLLSLPELPPPSISQPIANELAIMQEAAEWQQRSFANQLKTPEEEAPSIIQILPDQPAIKDLRPNENRFESELEDFINSHHYDI